jgi:hypothetical protein
MRLPIEIVPRRRRANFDAYEIGQPVSGPLETLDSDEPWMDDHFTQENFEQLQDAQMDGELGPPLDMSKRAGTLPTSFTYWIDMDERGEFRATVHDSRGREVMSINEEIFEDGYMRHKKDLSGLASYLEDLGIGGRGTQVQIARNASFARRAGRPLHEIARDIRRDWKNVHFAAVPYLQAMSQLDSVNDSYFEDDGAYIVRYFLSNSNSWRGPVAKEIKAELKAMLPRSRFARFAEGDSAGFEKWLKTQPKSVQDDWEANKEKYGDKFKTAGLTTHLASPDNKGFALCGQRLYPNTTVKDYTEATCYYCLLGFNKNRERMIQKNHENRGYGDKFKTAAFTSKPMVYYYGGNYKVVAPAAIAQQLIASNPRSFKNYKVDLHGDYNFVVTRNAARYAESFFERNGLDWEDPSFDHPQWS